MTKIEEFLNSAVKVLSLLAVTSLVSGFFIWNIYLVRLGFYEFNIIQARYIHAGIIFIAYIVLPVFLFVIFLQYLHKRVPLFVHFLVSCVGAILFILFLIFYSLKIFPGIPQSLGGAQPRVLSIIASESDIEYLARFDIKNVYSEITVNLCIAYENQDYILVLLDNRILSINKEIIKGFNSIPASTRDDFVHNCSQLARKWVLNQDGWIPVQLN